MVIKKSPPPYGSYIFYGYWDYQNHIIQMDPKKDIIVNRDSEKLPKEFISLIESLGFNYIDLSDTIQSLKNQGQEPHFWEATSKSGHWNHTAHEAVSDYLFKQLIALKKQDKLEVN